MHYGEATELTQSLTSGKAVLEDSAGAVEVDRDCGFEVANAVSEMPSRAQILLVVASR